MPKLVTYSAGSVDSPSAARDAAMWLRRQLRMGAGPTGSLMSIAERIGVLYSVVDLDGDGASVINGDYAVSVVNLGQDFGRRRSTAAHELGHVFLGDEYSSDIAVHTAKDEKEALIDAFASEFLLPSRVLTRKAEPLKRSDLVGIAAGYQVSWSLAIRQAELAGAVDEAQAKEWGGCRPTHAEFMDSLGWVPQPDLEKLRVSPLVAHAVLQAYEGGYITSSRAVEMMRGQIAGPGDLPAVDEELDLQW
ncbi:ImmA/IrrE family metallo-endopeptidase [Glycomyces halotolerans]